MEKNPLAHAGDPGFIPGSERSPGVGNSNPFRYSWQENPMDRGAWWATVHRVTKSQTHVRMHACSHLIWHRKRKERKLIFTECSLHTRSLTYVISLGGWIIFTLKMRKLRLRKDKSLQLREVK